MKSAATALCLALCLAAPAAAQCRLALVLALDISSSVDDAEYELQREGVARSLEDEGIRAAFLEPLIGHVALSIYEWSGIYQQRVIQRWTEVTGEAVLDDVVARLRAHRRSTDEFPTSLGNAIGFGRRLLERGPPCAQRTIDISGDGMNNDGYPPKSAYRAYDWTGITVNGLVVGGDSAPELAAYYLNEVIRGPGAFIEIASDYSDYGDAMRRKLLRELRPEFILGERG